jgi:hypothetical protein
MTASMSTWMMGYAVTLMRAAWIGVKTRRHSVIISCMHS